MLRSTTIAFFLSFSSLSIGQFNLETNLVMGGSLSDEARHIAIAENGTTLFMGSRTLSNDIFVPGNAGGADFWIVKGNTDGTLDWTRTYGGSGNDDLVSLMPLPDGGVLAFGTTETSQGIHGSLSGLAGGWLMRTNANGVLIDGEIFGGTVVDQAVEAVRHASGNITLLLDATSPELDEQFNQGGTDAWIVHVNQAFSQMWSLLVGGTEDDHPVALDADETSNLYVLINTQSDIPGLEPNEGGTDLWVIKLDLNGNILWQIALGGTGEDIGTDILAHPDGSVYVMAHSNSADGVFGQNSGQNDLWLIKLNGTNGGFQWAKPFGGSGNDINGKISHIGNEDILISATSWSQNGDLTGNKGLADVWIFRTNAEGDLVSQMNYGGSAIESAGSLVVNDPYIHVLATTLSSDKNVPSNPLLLNNVWYFSLNTQPDSCSNQLLCDLDPDDPLDNHMSPQDDESLLCIQGCLAGLGPGPIVNSATCSVFDSPTAYFFLTTDTMADLLNLSVQSLEFNQPQLALFKSTNCVNFQLVECTSGENGEALISYLTVEPLTTYIVAVSDAEGNIGDFELCATSIHVQFCNVFDQIYATSTSLGSPLSGPYLPGEEVQICYELSGWQKLDCNGFQGLVPSFGPGWDPVSFSATGMPLHIDTMIAPATIGFWEWYELGDVRYNVSNPINGYVGGQGMPAGWYFTNSADPPPNDHPDQTTGDINQCTPTEDIWKICFTLKVINDCVDDVDCSVSMKTFSDGEVGINISLACAYDQPEVFHAFMKCCNNPYIQQISDINICSGDTVNFTPTTNLLPPVSYHWTAEADPFISGATDGQNAANFFQVLTNSSAIPLGVRYNIHASGSGCQTPSEMFAITVYPSPVCTLNLVGPSTICSGDLMALRIENRGTPPFVITLHRSNSFFANILTTSMVDTLYIDPVFGGTFTIEEVKDANCIGSGVGSATVNVIPASTSIIEAETCQGVPYIVGDEEYYESGNYVTILDGAAQNGCDSAVILTLTVIPALTETIREDICNGDTLFVLDVPYTETTQQLIEYADEDGCTQYINLILTVRDTFYTQIDQTICGGDTLLFHGTKVFATGTYTHVGEIRPGCYETDVLDLTVLAPIVINEMLIVGDNGSGSGQILLEIVGGNPPYHFNWSNGEKTESIFSLTTGNYTLTVTDSEGCVKLFTFFVPFSTATDDVDQPVSEIHAWPTLVGSGDPVYIINQGAKAVLLQGATLTTLNGSIVTLPTENLIEPGGRTFVTLPDYLSTGLYILGIRLADGKIWRTKIMVR